MLLELDQVREISLEDLENGRIAISEDKELHSLRILSTR